MAVDSRIEEPRNQFPVGLRVLAVDDDLTCLRLLETLLRRCRYHVTATTNAITALKLLRDNRDKFDLVISDVQMPDMDGFKLLELVGLEMDLPVIMLSANGDTKLVMKGIIHGACDYLLKPVRIEELKNIWQHVIRRKKTNSRDYSCSDNQEKPKTEPGEGVMPACSGNSDVKLNKRRKDLNENEFDEHAENDQENEDPSTQKKPRVVWSSELHKKFVAAVNHLGIDKAVPKKILDLMNVEKLTRENVASHLQKYRLYLKRISSVASHQANMVAAFNSADSPYLRLGSVGGFGNYQTLAGSGQLQRTFGLFPPGVMLGRLNTPTSSLHGHYSPRMVQLAHAQNANNLLNDWQKFQPVVLPGSQDGGTLNGVAVPLKHDQLQQKKGVGCIEEFSTTINNPTIFPTLGGYLNTNTVGSSSNSLVGIPSRPFTIHKHPQGTQSRAQLVDQSPVSVASSNSEIFSQLPDPGRCDDIWKDTVQSSVMQSNSLPLGESLKLSNFHPSSLRDKMPSMTPHIESQPSVLPSITSVPLQQDLKPNLECEGQHPSNAGDNMSYCQNQGWDVQKMEESNHSNLIFSSLHSASPASVVKSPFGDYLDPKKANFYRSADSDFIEEQNCSNLVPIQPGVENSAMETTSKSKQGLLNGLWKPQNSYSSNSFGSLEDLVGAMMKPEQDNGFNIMAGDFGCEVGTKPLPTNRRLNKI